MADKMVKVYTTPSCPYCVMVKEYLKKNNADYQEFNVASDDSSHKKMVAISHQEGVPVIDIDGVVIVGFNRGEIDRALNLKK